MNVSKGDLAYVTGANPIHKILIGCIVDVIEAILVSEADSIGGFFRWRVRLLSSPGQGFSAGQVIRISDHHLRRIAGPSIDTATETESPIRERV